MGESLVSRARGVVVCRSPYSIETEEYEDAVWFAASVLHDLWLIPTSPQLEEAQ